ncbi:MAG: tRNA uridine-5-carboxymethylaminomethyl(34) synthesis GTPase MnmE [Gammaproteobacteria bacterium]|nr:tRNA uridine-5-carboxymethylaminomethyl(34) synthesis GTPase MnmE [Gammaproteobacteria bacterium]
MTNKETKTRSETRSETIVALATPAGRGGVGIIRISGPEAQKIAKAILGHVPQHRKAEFLDFKDAEDQLIDQGIALFFQAPHSFTGEDVLELQGHGGPVILDMLLKRTLEISGRAANPGEFSERAFLNDKIDLTQAEAIADLIESGSEQAARKAMQSLQGVFSSQIHELAEAITHLRSFVEASIDFPEEEIDFLSDKRISTQLNHIIQSLADILKEAKQGAILREGMHVVIVGRPNVGKSSLLNALAGRESAIVTDVPGTTRDLLREQILIEGIPVHVTDTAGLRESEDKVEQIGIHKAKEEISKADLILLVLDSTEHEKADLQQLWPDFIELPSAPVTVLRNKADLSGEDIVKEINNSKTTIHISAKENKGINILRNHLKEVVGFESSLEGGFMARRRHLESLDKVNTHLSLAEEQLLAKAGELLAEELRICQQHLSEITGEFSSDDLLGRIFSSFCIGK